MKAKSEDYSTCMQAMSKTRNMTIPDSGSSHSTECLHIRETFEIDTGI